MKNICPSCDYEYDTSIFIVPDPSERVYNSCEYECAPAKVCVGALKKRSSDAYYYQTFYDCSQTFSKGTYVMCICGE